MRKTQVRWAFLLGTAGVILMRSAISQSHKATPAKTARHQTTTSKTATSKTPRPQDSRGNLRALGLALTQYIEDFDDTLPPMHNPAQVHDALQYYVKSDTTFFQPGTTVPYQPNPALSGKKEDAVKGRVVALYEAQPSGRSRWALFLPLHVKYDRADLKQAVQPVSYRLWPKIKQSSQLP